MSIGKGCTLRVREHVTDSGGGAHVEVATDEVNVVPRHVSVEAAQEECGGITFLGYFVVEKN